MEEKKSAGFKCSKYRDMERLSRYHNSYQKLQDVVLLYILIIVLFFLLYSNIVNIEIMEQLSRPSRYFIIGEWTVDLYFTV